MIKEAPRIHAAMPAKQGDAPDLANPMDYTNLSSDAMFSREIGRFPIPKKPEVVRLFQGRGRGEPLSSILEAPVFTPAFKEAYQTCKSVDDVMILGNLRLVRSVASKHMQRAGGRMELADLIHYGIYGSDGTGGLKRGIEKFKYKKNYEFSTYATWWIRQGVTQALINKAPTIRLPANLINNLNRLWRLEEHFTQEHGRPPEPSDSFSLLLKSGMGALAARRTVDARDAQLHQVDSLNRLVGNNNRDEGTELGELIAAPTDSASQDQELGEQRREAVEEALKRMPKKMRRLVRLRFGLGGGQPLTLDETGIRMGFSKETARKLEMKAMSRLEGQKTKSDLKKHFYTGPQQEVDLRPEPPLPQPSEDIAWWWKNGPVVLIRKGSKDYVPPKEPIYLSPIDEALARENPLKYPKLAQALTEKEQGDTIRRLSDMLKERQRKIEVAKARIGEVVLFLRDTSAHKTPPDYVSKLRGKTPDREALRYLRTLSALTKANGAKEKILSGIDKKLEKLNTVVDASNQGQVSRLYQNIEGSGIWSSETLEKAKAAAHEVVVFKQPEAPKPAPDTTPDQAPKPRGSGSLASWGRKAPEQTPRQTRTPKTAETPSKKRKKTTARKSGRKIATRPEAPKRTKEKRSEAFTFPNGKTATLTPTELATVKALLKGGAKPKELPGNTTNIVSRLKPMLQNAGYTVNTNARRGSRVIDVSYWAEKI